MSADGSEDSLEREDNEEGGGEREGGESEPDEPEELEPEKVKEPPAPEPKQPKYTPRMDPLSNVMNINKELDMLGSKINHTCTMLKYRDYGKNYNPNYGMSPYSSQTGFNKTPVNYNSIPHPTPPYSNNLKSLQS